MCCQVLTIEHFNKDAGVLCQHCVLGGGCKIYKKRPDVCQDYECDWMMERSIPSTLRPDKVGTILMEDADSDEYQAVCDPKKPMAWRWMWARPPSPRTCATWRLAKWWHQPG